MTFDAPTIITTKRDGGRLSDAAIDWVIDAYTNEWIADEQMSALLMAIFRYTPSPFCILDEVDAPLDEPNIERLTRLIKRMSAETQFIVITHAKRTMEAAQALYGVTMQEPGISKLVSVRFEPLPPETETLELAAV